MIFGSVTLGGGDWWWSRSKNIFYNSKVVAIHAVLHLEVGTGGLADPQTYSTLYIRQVWPYKLCIIWGYFWKPLETAKHCQSPLESMKNFFLNPQ